MWTGPRYRFDATKGTATLTNPAACNAKFQVEVANDPSFPAASTILSSFINVGTDPTSGSTNQCYGTWTPSAAQWNTLQAGGKRVYYQARTRNAAGANERLSTTPGDGLWTVPPPYAVITPDGNSDY